MFRVKIASLCLETATKKTQYTEYSTLDEAILYVTRICNYLANRRYIQAEIKIIDPTYKVLHHVSI